MRYRFRGRRISERDGERIMDVLLCFWASLARELDKPPGWARGWARMIVPVLADARDDAWWLARERRASRRRKGNGWNPDAAANHWGIHEHQLDECFGPNKRRRCGLVSVERPPEVRAEEKRERDKARKRAKAKRPRAVYEAESASRLKPWKAFGIERRAWERRGKPAPPQAETTTQVGSVASPEREYATHLRRPRPTAAKEGRSRREAVSPGHGVTTTAGADRRAGRTETRTSP